ncbi:MAG: lactate racemase domain-containing protein [Bacillota bacterium]|nr:lactate racemase domain-containing protein [Bacillota bacterium]
MYRIRQNIPAHEIEDINHEVIAGVERLPILDCDIKGFKIGIAVGSRGIYKLTTIVKSVIKIIIEKGGEPSIISAMGSHGGGTEQGQYEVLASLGISEEAMGVPIRCCTDSTLLGYTDEGIPVYCNNAVFKVDKVVLVNRIKTHTDFSGKIESGICKMLSVGLGNPDGAMTVHAHSLEKGYEHVISQVATYMIEKIPILFAVGILENWVGKTSKIEAFLAKDIISSEHSLLAEMKAGSIKLPFSKIDVLIIENIGKNISGTGMDTKVVGRIMVIGQKEPEEPVIKRIVVLNLTPESHGNATGIGLADITTMSVFKAIDIKTTAINSISSMSPEQGRLPCILGNEYEAIKAAIFTLGTVDVKKVKMVYIKDTLSLEYMIVSSALLSEVNFNPCLEILGAGEDLIFDSEGKIAINWEKVSDEKGSGAPTA